MLPVRIHGSDRALRPRWTGSFGLTDRSLDPLFDELFGRFPDATTDSCRANIWEDGEHVCVEMELPGLTEKDIQVNVEKGVLTISGKRHTDCQRNGRSYHFSERLEGEFSRSFHLGKRVDENKVNAGLKDGILTVELAKRPEAKRRKVEVKAG